MTYHEFHGNASGENNRKNAKKGSMPKSLDQKTARMGLVRATAFLENTSADAQNKAAGNAKASEGISTATRQGFGK